MEKIWNRTKWSNNKEREREEIGGFIFGLKIQNNYEEIKNELKARRKNKVSLNELKEIIDKISGEKRLEMISK